MHKMSNNKIANILIGIDLILLFSLYPIFVPKYLSETSFLLGWFILTGISSLIIKLIVTKRRNTK